METSAFDNTRPGNNLNGKMLQFHSPDNIPRKNLDPAVKSIHKFPSCGKISNAKVTVYS
ncbi:hypothetical protein SAMN05661012_00692 [Chitinophaga sancti]|uniref:Uncharacterized protein n=1 Tax=Chitinophaga sancti TaxID=1004 RepID=A0A1K1MLV6_9BACT|nr:hypothetical protein SAMN05661012_00692 [Chitinophaga sancti]